MNPKFIAFLTFYFCWFVYWLGGGEFERSIALASTAAWSVIISVWAGLLASLYNAAG